MLVYTPTKLENLSKQRVVNLQKSNALQVYILWNFPSQLIKAEVPVSHDEKITKLNL